MPEFSSTVFLHHICTKLLKLTRYRASTSTRWHFAFGATLP